MIPSVDQVRESTKVNYARMIEEAKASFIRTWASDIQLAVSKYAQDHIKIHPTEYMIGMPSFRLGVEALIRAYEAYRDAGYIIMVRYYDRKNDCPDEIIISWSETMPEEPCKIVYGRG